MRSPHRIAPLLFAAMLAACADGADRINAPDVQHSLNAPPDLAAAIAAQERHTAALLRNTGVVGTAVGLSSDGRAVVQVLLAHGNVPSLPLVVDGVPVVRVITGEFHARSDPRVRARPAPIGFSVGHPAITAGTIGARVRDALGNVYVLSNNHVLANSNGANVGDATLQPGPADGGQDPGDRIGTLAAFQSINFSGANNLIDAAIASTTTDMVGSSTPADDGYGASSGRLFNDVNGDIAFDDIAALLNLSVQKYGRTTKLTRGAITGINAVVDVCYEVLIIFCVKSAHFVDQLIITPGAFSGGGDSGSMIVTDDGNKDAVALLFAGSSANTIANRMDHVLRRFSVTIDGAASQPPPPPPALDVEVVALSAPGSVTEGDLVPVTVNMKNNGTTPVVSDITVTLTDEADAQVIGTAVISGGLAAGAATSLNYSWNTTGESTGPHTLTARHDVTDDVPANNARSTSVTVNANTPAGLHFGDLDGFSLTESGGKWRARVVMTVHGPNHEILANADAGGIWNDGVEFTCTTNANGQCLAERVLRNRVTSVTFVVAGVVFGLTPFTPEFNHDPDADSDGTMITVRKP